MGTARNPTSKLTTMAEVATALFNHLTDEEITAIHQYLSRLPQTGVPGAR